MESASVQRAAKRLKTLRACDYCRAHRIRCDVMPGHEECKHCFEYGLTCEKVAPPPKDHRKRVGSGRPRASTSSSRPSSPNAARGAAAAEEDEEEEEEDESGLASQGIEPIYLGPTSLVALVGSYLLRKGGDHRRMREVDDAYDHIREAFEGRGTGLLVGRSVERDGGGAVGWSDKDGGLTFRGYEAKLAKEVGGAGVLVSLFDRCMDMLIPLFPVVSVTESNANQATSSFWRDYLQLSFDSTPPSPLPRIVRLTHCALAASSRDVPPPIRRSVLGTLHRLLCGPEMAKLARTSSLAGVQVMLLLSMGDALNPEEGAFAGGASWERVSTAIKMAFDIGLHRQVSSVVVPRAQINRRRRVWGACLIADRWTALRRGQPPLINTEDCDALLPFIYPDHASEHAKEGENRPPCFRFLLEMSHLAILLSRTTRLTSGPRGLSATDDAALHAMRSDIDAYLSQLPARWPYSVRKDLAYANELLNLFIIALELTFLRPFVFSADPIPEHITYVPEPLRFAGLVQRARDAVLWLQTPEGKFYLDTWTWTTYPLICCAMIHLEAYRQSSDPTHLDMLDRANAITQSWAEYVELPASSASTSPWPEGRTEKTRLAAMVQLLRDSAGDRGPGRDEQMLRRGSDDLRGVGLVHPGLAGLYDLAYDYTTPSGFR